MSESKKVAFELGDERVEGYVIHVEAQNVKLQNNVTRLQKKVSPKVGKYLSHSDSLPAPPLPHVTH